MLHSESLNKDIVKKYIEDVENTGITDHIPDYISPDYVEVYEGKRYKLGIEGAIKHVTGVHNTWPDIKLVIERQICEGEWVATIYTMSGTQKLEWLGIKPNGKKMTVTCVNIDRVVDGKIVEHGGAANFMQPLLNSGAIRIS